MRSLTSAAYSGAKVAITYLNLVAFEVMRLVRNCASTCTNHNSGSVGQNVGSLRETVATVLSGEGERGIVVGVRDVWVTNVKYDRLNQTTVIS